MLEDGASAGAVAAVLGHRDLTMVRTVYGKHFKKREKHLRECLDEANGQTLLFDLSDACLEGTMANLAAAQSNSLGMLSWPWTWTSTGRARPRTKALRTG